MAATGEVVELAEEWGITPTELSIAWAIARPCNASVRLVQSWNAVQVDQLC